jgi:hypothetical protein
VRAAPAVSCARCTKKAHTSIQVQRKHSGIPHAMALQLMPCSPRRRIRLVTVIGRLNGLARPGWARNTSANLTPATGARTTWFCRTPQPGFAGLLTPFVLHVPQIAHEVQPALRPQLRADAVASTTSRPAFVTTRDRPSYRNGMGVVKSLIWGCGEAEDCPSS